MVGVKSMDDTAFYCATAECYDDTRTRNPLSPMEKTGMEETIQDDTSGGDGQCHSVKRMTPLIRMVSVTVRVLVAVRGFDAGKDDTSGGDGQCHSVSYGSCIGLHAEEDDTSGEDGQCHNVRYDSCTRSSC
ncbi:hypothetical protein PoB_000597900 [Plakobranchus ocellatus]|uniref:Uncharacterized protein n=1 Tax=Plakobranchus ocellatus TaxID=259542 RepID=A0AAV3YB12_9GAST|nr:hypothetical protein PoB_000597900 [Plakobranchus ocellatus]